MFWGNGRFTPPINDSLELNFLPDIHYQDLVRYAITNTPYVFFQKSKSQSPRTLIENKTCYPS